MKPTLLSNLRADRQTAAGDEPSETVLLTKTRLKEKLAKLKEEIKRLAAIERALPASPVSSWLM